MANLQPGIYLGLESRGRSSLLDASTPTLPISIHVGGPGQLDLRGSIWRFDVPDSRIIEPLLSQTQSSVAS